MSSRNICKFISYWDQGQLAVSNFILETETPHSGEQLTLSNNKLYLFMSGSGLYRNGGLCHYVSAGTVAFSFAGHPFTIESTNDLQYYYISFGGERSDELFRRFAITPQNCVFEGYDGLLPLWKDSLARSNEENIDLLSESLILYTFSKLKKPDKTTSDVVTYVLTYLDEHFTESNLTLAQIANSSGYNEKYLSHIFKKQFGMKFSEYLRLMRIKHSVMLIENGVTSVKNVAFLSGFGDPLYFSKVFTEVVGVSPAKYKVHEEEDK